MAYENDYTEQRKTERLSIMMEVNMKLGDQMIEGELSDISAGGAKVRTTLPASDAPESTAEPVILNIPKFGDFEGEIVWRDGKFVGIAFAENHKALVSLVREMATHIAAA